MSYDYKSTSLPHDLLVKLATALGLEKQGITKIVLELGLDDIPRVYVSMFVDKRAEKDIVDVLAPGTEIEFIPCDGPIIVDERGGIDVSTVRNKTFKTTMPKKQSGGLLGPLSRDVP